MDVRARAWDALEAEHARLLGVRTQDLLRDDPERANRLVLQLGALRADFTRQRIDAPALRALLVLADACALQAEVHRLFAGEPVNRSERRAALHTALRAPLPGQDETGAAADAARAAHAALERMERIVATVRDAPEDQCISDFVHVGIGGSDLGPRLVCEALAHLSDGRVRVHFVANVDGTAVDRLIRTLDPRRTMVSLVSKSFTTQETLLNGQALRAWLSHALGTEGAARHLLATTANVEAASAFGVPPDGILPMWDWVGGRYSVWSAVGLPIAVSLGIDAFRRLLAGAHTMDVHYASAPPERNMPVLMALCGIWNRNLLGCATLAVIPYDDRLARLPAYLQQLEMESNGKRVDEFGAALKRPAAPVIWGDVGTNVQHAFFQALHQGVDTVPLDLIGVVRPAHSLSANHTALLANLLAQSAAFLRGTDTGTPNERSCPGDRPHTVLLLDQLTPEALGMLLALYEHKVHAQGRIWGINSFDQWGVELGKRIAATVLPALETGEIPANMDPSTAALIQEIRAMPRTHSPSDDDA